MVTTKKDGAVQVVVVGAGVAGLSAALSAREAGADVVVLDRAPETDFGGNTRYTEAYLRMKSIDEVADDFEDALVDDFMGYPDPSLVGELYKDYDDWPQNLRSLSTLDPLVVSNFAEQAGPTLQWMSGHGVVFTEIVTQFLTTSTARIAPRGGGLAIVESLSKAASEAGAAFEFRTTATDLVLGDTGEVAGVRARTSTGTRVFEGRVILACGGFEGNAEMTARYFGERGLHIRPVCRGGYYNKGEGIQMALNIGAAPCGNFGMFHAEPIDPRSGVAEPSIMIFPYGILVNKHGERFTDEAIGPIDATYEGITRKLHHQPDGIGYAILDAKVADVPNYRTAIRTDQPAFEADTIDGLAELIGVPVDDLVATVQAYNGACVDGDYDPTRTDGLSTSGLRPAKSNWALPLDSAPYIAYPVISSNVFTYGGLKVDVDARVIHTDGSPIAGLYAAGETVGMYFTNYAGSTSVLKGAVFGRIAGGQAAQA